MKETPALCAENEVEGQQNKEGRDRLASYCTSGEKSPVKVGAEPLRPVWYPTWEYVACHDGPL